MGLLAHPSTPPRAFHPAGKLIGKELQPLYEAAVPPPLSAMAQQPPRAPPPLLPTRLLELLGVAGQHLYHSVVVLTKLTRLLRVTLAHAAAAAGGMQQHEQVGGGGGARALELPGRQRLGWCWAQLAPAADCPPSPTAPPPHALAPAARSWSC